MRTLVIDSATEACSAALFARDECIAGEYRLLGRGHAERLIPMIAGLPDKGRADTIAVALGPGSFTGVRVGLAAARALAFAWEARLFGYPTPALIAASARDGCGAQPLAVAMNAGHGEWFVQHFGEDGGALGEVASLSPEAALAKIVEPLVAGSAAADAVARRGFGEALDIRSDARAFALLDPRLLTADVHPLYGRAPDAQVARVRR